MKIKLFRGNKQRLVSKEHEKLQIQSFNKRNESPKIDCVTE